jgi:hypothetical protein
VHAGNLKVHFCSVAVDKKSRSLSHSLSHSLTECGKGTLCCTNKMTTPDSIAAKSSILMRMHSKTKVNEMRMHFDKCARVKERPALKQKQCIRHGEYKKINI